MIIEIKFKTYNTLTKFFFVLVIILSVGFSCRQTDTKHQNNIAGESVHEASARYKLNFMSPQINQVFKTGQAINLQVSAIDSTDQPDSIQFLVDGKRINGVKKTLESATWNTENAKVGEQNIEAVAYYGSNTKGQGNIKVRLVSGTPEIYYTYKIVKAYPHDPSAYTQGLIFSDNYLFEGTGQYGQSTLRKVKLSSGEIMQVYNLPNEVFGEGIATFNDKIIQITWQEQVAFIFDKTSFRLLNKLYYPMKEGWGITFDGTYLIMSDGSANLYFLDKDYFTEVSRLEVCDNHGPVQRLNELEYIEGEVWANVYTTDTIVRINPKTGVITGKIDMSGLLKPEDRTSNVNVLNGIAYNSLTKQIFVTGKNWPKLFEINVFQKRR
jgi:glutamine cyclotransferase